MESAFCLSSTSPATWCWGLSAIQPHDHHRSVLEFLTPVLLTPFTDMCGHGRLLTDSCGHGRGRKICRRGRQNVCVRTSLFCVHCSRSSVNVLLGLPLAFFHSNFPSNSNKAFEPPKPLILCPVHASFCLSLVCKMQTLWFHSCKTFYLLLCTSIWFSACVYSTTVKMHQFIYSVFCSGSSFRMRISPLTARNSPTNVSLFIAPAVLWRILHASRKLLWTMQFLFDVTFYAIHFTNNDSLHFLHIYLHREFPRLVICPIYSVTSSLH